jgi:signal transduction histidine kinase/streptogramin lyase
MERPDGSPEIEAVCASIKGGLWVAASRELSHFTNLSSSFPATTLLPDEIEAPRARVNSLIEDSSGRVWAGTAGGGIFCFNPESGWQRVTARRSRPLGPVDCLYQDSEGLVWAGTSRRGLYQINPRLVSTWLFPLAAAYEGTPHTVCVARDGNIWVGTDGAGVFRIGKGGTTRFGQAEGLQHPSVTAILEDRKTNLWFGTPRGLYLFEDGRIRAVTNSAVANRGVTALHEGPSGRLWIGLTGTLVRMDDDEFQVFELPDRYRQAEIRAIAQNQANTVWIGARGGGIFRLFKGQLQRFNGFQRPAVISLHFDADDAMWVGTLNRGLWRVKDTDIMCWTTEDGLPDNTPYAILEDANRTFWISSNEGVFGVSRDVLTNYSRTGGPPLLVQHLAGESGLKDAACLASGQPSAARSADGRFWFPTTRGVISFDPAGLLRERPPPTILLEEVFVDGVRHSAAGRTALRVPSTTRRLEFHFTSPNMDSPERLRFRHKLEGLEDDWVEAGAQRAVAYGPLPPGRYHFRVMAGLRDTWQPAANPFSIKVVPRFWQRMEFQLAAILAILIAAALAIRTVVYRRASRRLARLELERAMERERARIAKDLHDDLGTGLTEIMMLGELAARQETPSDEWRRHVTAITEKSHQLAVAMDETVWTVNPKNDSVPKLASYLADFAREFFSPTSIRFRIHLPDSLPALTLSAAQRHNLFLATKEALNNVARHSGAGEVWLRIRIENGQLEIIVEDDGCGFDPRQIAGEGNGLPNMGTRLEAIGGCAEIDSQPGRGTTVRFVAPMTDPPITRLSDSRMKPGVA